MTAPKLAKTQYSETEVAEELGHRIIDGALGATFLSAVAAELQNFNPDRDF